MIAVITDSGGPIKRGAASMFSKLKTGKKRIKMSQDEMLIEKWGELKKRGKRKYIWIDGGVKFGVGIPTFIVLIDLLIRDNVYPTVQAVFRDYIGRVMFFSIIGIISNRSTWNTLENWSLKHKAREEFENINIDFCYYCGSDIEDTDICPECGKKLEL